jgi:hypothetical protein
MQNFFVFLQFEIYFISGEKQKSKHAQHVNFMFG